MNQRPTTARASATMVRKVSPSQKAIFDEIVSLYALKTEGWHRATSLSRLCVKPAEFGSDI
jgi:hypothetical protein